MAALESSSSPKSSGQPVGISSEGSAAAWHRSGGCTPRWTLMQRGHPAHGSDSWNGLIANQQRLYIHDSHHF